MPPSHSQEGNLSSTPAKSLGCISKQCKFSGAQFTYIRTLTVQELLELAQCYFSWSPASRSKMSQCV